MKKISKELLEKFVNSKCTKKEKQIVETWFLNNEYNDSLNTAVKNQFYEILENNKSGLEYSEVMALLNKVHEKIGVNATIKEKKNPIRVLYSTFVKIAAVLFIPLLLSILFLTTDYLKRTPDSFVEIVTPPAARIHFTLPDGSSGWLNSKSILRYNAGLQGSERKVQLIGEGFFDVVKNPDRPFIVKSNNVEVKVLGTKFNVNSYLDDSNIKVTLQRGKVEVYGLSKSNNKTKLTTLSPGESVSIQKSNTQKFSKTKLKNTNLITAWTEDILVFRGGRMDLVAKKLSRWFNVTVTLNSDELKDYRLHATFHQESLDEILKLIKLTAPIDYKIIKRKKLMDGTYSKEEIVFFKKDK